MKYVCERVHTCLRVYVCMCLSVCLSVYIHAYVQCTVTCKVHMAHVIMGGIIVSSCLHDHL